MARSFRISLQVVGLRILEVCSLATFDDGVTPAHGTCGKARRGHGPCSATYYASCQFRRDGVSLGGVGLPYPSAELICVFCPGLYPSSLNPWVPVDRKETQLARWRCRAYCCVWSRVHACPFPKGETETTKLGLDAAAASGVGVQGKELHGQHGGALRSCTRCWWDGIGWNEAVFRSHSKVKEVWWFSGSRIKAPQPTTGFVLLAADGEVQGQYHARTVELDPGCACACACETG